METEERQQILHDWLSRHKGLLFKIVRAYAFTPEDREDLFQEVATQIWRSIPGFRSDSAPTTWLYQIALNTAVSWARKELKHRKREQLFADMERTLSETPRGEDRRLVWLYEQIAQLDPVDRSVTLLLLDGFSYREMSQMLGISESNVGVKINRIKNYLTRLMKEEPNHGL
jgi:RNA polymerase sigma-70 factor (ECF subfamily)